MVLEHSKKGDGIGRVPPLLAFPPFSKSRKIELIFKGTQNPSLYRGLWLCFVSGPAHRLGRGIDYWISERQVAEVERTP